MDTPPPPDAAGPDRHTDPRHVSAVAVARTDLGSRLGVDPDDITVESVEEVTWRDGSLGCPQPGMRYRQVIINGQRIVLRHGGSSYAYHSGGGRPPFLCADPSGPGPLAGRHGPI